MGIEMRLLGYASPFRVEQSQRRESIRVSLLQNSSMVMLDATNTRKGGLGIGGVSRSRERLNTLLDNLVG